MKSEKLCLENARKKYQSNIFKKYAFILRVNIFGQT